MAVPTVVSNDGELLTQGGQPTLLRCEHCTACAHPACAGIDEDDEALASVLDGFSQISNLWFCGGVACGRRGKNIEGGRAAAVAAAIGHAHAMSVLSLGVTKRGKMMDA